jgi:hypothetical protein
LLLLGDTVAAARASFALAVGENLLAFAKLDLFVGPKDVVAHAVRDIDQAILIEGHNLSVFNVEVGVVSGDNGIVAGGHSKFLGAFDATGNY